MKTILFLLAIGLFSTSSLKAIDVFKEKLTLLENNNYGLNGVDLSFLMTKDEKDYQYNYSVGYFSGSFMNMSMKENYPFTVRDKNSRFTNNKPKWSPMLYLIAYEMMKGELMPVGASIIRTMNSKNIVIFCTEDMKICKTDSEIKKYEQSKYALHQEIK